MGAPLEGIRVIEVATALQGPAAGLYLCDMGAEVIKLEPPEGETSRFHRGVNNYEPPGTPGAQFAATSRGKRSIVLDAHWPESKEVFRRLIEKADIFLSNYLEEALVRMGMGYEELRAINPRLIYAVVNGFGPQGPDRAKGMVDGAGQARGGLINITGEAGGPPMLPGAAIADMAGAMQFVLGIMTALVARERFGIGQKVQTSSYGAQLWLQTWELTQSSITGRALTRGGSHHPNVPGTYGVYETKDRRAIFHAFARTEAAWQAFCAFAGHAEVAEDERWNSVQKRMGMGSDAEGAAARQVRPFMQEAFASKTLAEWTDFLETQPEIIYNTVATYDDVLADPQAAANDYFVEIDVPHAGPRKLIGNLVHLSETPGAPQSLIPELGQHTEEILLELGYDWTEIVAINEHTREALQDKFLALGVAPPR